jgi:hypothetical protein
MKLRNTAIAITLTATSVIGFTAYAASSTDAGTEKSISPRVMADALHLVMDSDRAVYTKRIVNRLAAKEKVITASEHFKDEKALVLPAQMFRFGSELVAERAEKNPDINFSYSLQSLWPINKQNAPKTDAEKEGLQYIVDNPGKNFYANEKLGDINYFTAIYADVAVSPVCATCHNEHKDTPKDDFKIGDTMGGVVIRIPVDG